MIKRLTQLALLSTSFVTAQEGEIPPEKCVDDTITEVVCSRSVTQQSTKPASKNYMTMTYWVTLENSLPYFHAHMELLTVKPIDGKAKKTQLRMCVEFGTEESKELWREQIMFHADVAAGTSKVETALTWGKQAVWKKNVTAEHLADALSFCSYKEDNEGFEKSFEGDADYIEHSHKGDPN